MLLRYSPYLVYFPRGVGAPCVRVVLVVCALIVVAVVVDDGGDDVDSRDDRRGQLHFVLSVCLLSLACASVGDCWGVFWTVVDIRVLLFSVLVSCLLFAVAHGLS